MCDTMWVVRQADDPFVYFGTKPNKGLGLEISNEIGSGGGKELAKEPREGQLVKGDAVENRAEGTSQDELAVLSRQRSAEGSSEGRPVKMSWYS